MENVEHFSTLTGEELEIEKIQSIMKEDIKERFRGIYRNIQNGNIDDISFSDISFIKKGEKVYSESLSSDFVRTPKINKEMLLALDKEVLGYVSHIGMIANRDGVIRYGNGKLIPTFNKLKEELGVTSTRKWTKIKKAFEDNNIIATAKFDGNKFLVINPLYSNSHSEIDSYKFIAFHESLKSHLKFIDYLYLLKKFEIQLTVPVKSVVDTDKGLSVKDVAMLNDVIEND